ncbi:thiamine phosphate synthase [Shewanella algicola]|uniref:thiamine phosphate synthase n=1 Tax=Shewanella algicola TaxID=640633 RepID=UPI0024954DE2|nr:thiamine phosphate synthase [Shewanella algicola]
MNQPKNPTSTNVSSRPIVWTIAGSDSGGGAGIQADLLTMNDLECHGCSVMSAITAQNSLCVNLVEPVSASMLLAQLDTLWSDLPAKVIKIGLIANQQQLGLIAEWLRRLQQQSQLPFVVLDPVLVASSGDYLSDSRIDFSPLAGLISVITPNYHELYHLSASLLPACEPATQNHSQQHNMILAAQSLAEHFHCHVVAKGGDASWQQQRAIDVYVSKQVQGASTLYDNQVFLLSSARVDTTHHHGSGCTLSSAIASFVAHDYVVHDAIVLAKAYVTNGLIHSRAVGNGPGVLARTGWPDNLLLMPQISGVNAQHSHNNVNPIKAPRVAPLGVYPVLDCLSQLTQVLAAGCKTVQFRAKLIDEDDPIQEQQLEADICEVIKIGKAFNAQIFINDHWQLAIKHHAFGVHLGQEDLACANIEAIQQAGLALGISSHSYFEALIAHQCSPTYIALGHIYPTTTKQMPSAPQGLAKLRRYVSLMAKHYPTVAIGGINLSRLADVANSGVAEVAVVRAISHASDVAEAYRQLHQAWLHLTRTRKYLTVHQRNNDGQEAI